MATAKEAAEPGVDDVHVDSPVVKKPKKEMSADFLKHLYSQLKVNKAELSEDAFNGMVAKSRAHAGGKGKAAKAKGEPDDMQMGDVCGFRLFNEYEFAEPPEWMPLMPKPGEFNHPEYGKISITAERNANFIAQFKAAVYQSRLPINAEHKASADGAYGWITDMRQNSDGSVDGRSEWTDLGNTAIRNDRFRYISPEWFDVWEKKSTGEKHADIVCGAALTVRPFFKEDSLRPLVASERGLFVADVPDESTQSILIFFSALEPMAKDKPQEVDMADEAPKGMTDEQVKQFAELETNVKTLTEQLTIKDADLKKATERITTMEMNERRKRFTDEVTGKADNAVRWFGKAEDHVKLLMQFADTFGEESDSVKLYISQNRAAAEAIEKSDFFKEFGSDADGGKSDSPAAQLDTIAKKFVEKSKSSDKPLTYEQAYDRACRENESLALKA